MTERRVPIPNVESPLVPDSASSSSDPDHLLNTLPLSDEITDYPFHWGRRYNRYRENSYPFPNDEVETERLTDQHNIFKYYFADRLFWSPLDPESVTQVLDLGTGTGEWPIDLSDSQSLPKADIFGTDLSSIQPEEVPANVFFEIQDCADTEWLRAEASIDLIHSRFMAGSLTSYKRLMGTCMKYLKPGSGWLELHEIHPTPQCDDGTMPNDWKFKLWEEEISFASEQKMIPPRPTRVAGRLEYWMQQCGYVEVSRLVYKIPLSGWPKDQKLKATGKLYRDNWIHGLAGFSYKLLGSDGLGLSREEVELKIMEVRQCLEAKADVHAYLNYFVVYGRRPSEEEEKEEEASSRVNGG